MKKSLVLFVLAVLWCGAAAAEDSAHAYQYFRVGNRADRAGTPRAGFALMGGGTDLDDAFRWLCDRAGGGDVLVLRATGRDDYNPYIQKLCRVNSVSTIVIPNRAAAEDPFVAKAIHNASALFISGGDQANYINFWTGTPVQMELNAAIERGVPIGGTSAGLAVMGEYAYSAQGDKPDDPNLDGKTAMADPFGRQITLFRGFLKIPLLTGIITDTHFAKRDRMGRLLVFLARLNQAEAAGAHTAVHDVRGLGIEEKAAVLLDADGTGHVVGKGSAYWVDCQKASGTVMQGKPLTFGPYAVRKFMPGRSFKITDGIGDGALYQLTVTNGTLRSAQPGGSVY